MDPSRDTGEQAMSDFASLFSERSHGLVLPRGDEDRVDRYVAMHSSERAGVERRPFRRQLDFWAFSIVAALAWDLAPRDGPHASWGKVFIYTNQGILDNDLCSLLTVVAVAKLGHEDPEVGEPRRIVDLANRLAGAGCPEVLRKLSESSLRTTPLDRAIELARTLHDQVRSSLDLSESRRGREAP